MDPKEKELYLAIIVAIVLFSIIIIYFITSLILYQRRFITLQKERINAEINTLENERRRVASELHDGIGPLVSSVKLYINSIDVAAEDEETIYKAGAHIDDIMQNIRQISNNLMPNTLVRKGLDAAIAEFIAKVDNQNNVKISYSCEAASLSLDKDMEINIFRIIQEIVNNTIKHSGATQLIVKLKKESNQLLIQTRDNGKGFDFDSMKNKDVSKDGGLGLKNLESRVEVMGGHLFRKAHLIKVSLTFLKYH
ncbi:sensor histidine kinase [Solitalea canadensis]|uniref:histidine kinase n=1 Tax=Solitalea canadensis (strain ATCC 29591 / DSM 3403 / JCM 21819 / LMG 8368 / NBRC 15130 / NCIMB 12057 / USAM 9D) TaxID=929556 RepID=H8KU08_SOLCM|nr:ATP-binding protein [Solitalea canadensis]AFD06988.1 histidine kinase [Solitalea canadensis DSM 3403]